MKLLTLSSAIRSALSAVLTVALLFSGIVAAVAATERCVAPSLQSQPESPQATEQGCCCCGHRNSNAVKSNCDPGLAGGCSSKNADSFAPIIVSDTGVDKLVIGETPVNTVILTSRKPKIATKESPYRGDVYLTNLNLLC
jgi:hypothetical protein